MQAGWVFFYFLTGCGALALLIFPELRRGTLPFLRVSTHALGGLWRHGGRWIVWGGALALLPMLAVLGWGLTDTRQLEGFDDRVDAAPSQVALLLHGEHLVPPSPLPPDVFMTAEIEVARPMLPSADRRWDRMDPAFVQRLLAVFKVMKEAHGYEMALLEGHRSPERQAMLQSRGTHVTMAGAWQSWHQHGLAADCAFLRGGRLVISEKDPWAMRGYRLYGQEAERAGLAWGGRWRMMDFGHVEWRGPGVKAGVPPASASSGAITGRP